MIREAIILAGGLGTRLKKVVKEIPKSMALINDRPFLEYQLNYLESWGINRVILSVGYKSEIISDHFRNKYKSIEIEYSCEDEPLGTGGGIKKAFEIVKGQYALVFNGDTFFDVDLGKLNTFREKNELDVVLVLRYIANVKRYGAIKNNAENIITEFCEKNNRTGEGYINGGIYLINKEYFQKFDLPEKFSIEKDFFEKYFSSKEFYAFHSSSYFRDIGIPEDYYKAQDEFKKLPY
ncbi:MAG: nucleotidyltransferase family protein [Bacteroidales bacterium]|nr:nucleotidyltransferase family protein [Bacteroidales bacterium]